MCVCVCVCVCNRGKWRRIWLTMEFAGRNTACMMSLWIGLLERIKSEAPWNLTNIERLKAKYELS